MEEKKRFNQLLETIVRLGLIVFLLYWCFQILSPFLDPVLWATLLAIVLMPLHEYFTSKLNGRAKWSATLISVVVIALVLVPVILFFDSLVDGIRNFGTQLIDGEFKVPPPPDSVKDWPAIGDRLYNLWNQASQNLQGLMSAHSDYFTNLGKTMIQSLLGLTGGVLKFVISVIIAGVFLATSKSIEPWVKQLFEKVAGAKGGEFMSLCNQTIKNVAKGILGVAVIQSFFSAVAMLIAGIPYTGLWALIILVLAIIQLPPTLVFIPIIIWMYANMGAGIATLWTVIFLLIGISDNVLKPILLGKGAPVPMLVIFLGAIGGFIVSGFVGLFVGAIILSLGYKLFMAWLEDSKSVEVNTSLNSPSGSD